MLYFRNVQAKVPPSVNVTINLFCLHFALFGIHWLAIVFLLKGNDLRELPCVTCYTQLILYNS